jgi:hypothetical protein
LPTRCISKEVFVVIKQLNQTKQPIPMNMT